MMDRKSVHEIYRVDPYEPLVRLVSWAVSEVVETRHILSSVEGSSEWMGWANSWLDGKRQPGDCVRIAGQCFDKAKSNEHHAPHINHALGQLAWAAKEACYHTPQTGWLAVRYIADAMLVFGIACPDLCLSLGNVSIKSIPSKMDEKICENSRLLK